MDRKFLIETMDKRHGKGAEMNRKYLFEAMDTRQDAPVQETLTEAGDKLDWITQPEKSKVNTDIRKILFGAYKKSPGGAMGDIEDALSRHGFTGPGMYSADSFRGIGGTGTASFPVSRVWKKGDPGKGEDHEIKNTMLRVQWGKAGDRGNYDVVAYLS